MNIDGVEITQNGLYDFTVEEGRHYIELCKSKTNLPLKSVVVIAANDGMIDVVYDTFDVPFERIRRITGYLTGDLNSWNNAKQAEERERVKHGLGDFSHD